MKRARKLLIFLGILLCTIFLVSCKEKEETIPEGRRKYEEVEVIDDKCRNYYEIFVRSFYDSNGDGIGDLNGVTQNLDYIKDLGFNGIWLMPINSGASYHKYDVTDYYNIDHNFGTVEDLENLVKAAHEKGIDIIMDLVINHTSDKHPWFTNAKQAIIANGSPSGEYANYYNFTKSSSSGYAQIAGTSYYYEAQFWGGMPDLNLDNEAVRTEIVNIMRFWLNKGVDGFRLDATTSYYTNNISKNVSFLRWLYGEAKQIKEDVYMVGEAWYASDFQIRQYYDSGVDSFFIFPVAQGTGAICTDLREAKTNSGQLFGKLLTTQEETYDIGIMAPFLSNHDTSRAVSFLGKTIPNKTKFAQGLISLMKGAMFVYYGEEIGMSSPDTKSDPSKRVAILWDKKDSEGYCTKSPESIVVKEATYYSYGSVASQMEDPDSILNYYKYANYIRNANPEIARGTTKVFDDYYDQSSMVTVFQRTYNGSTITIVVNLSYENTYTINLNQEQLGYQAMTQYLCANYNEDVTLNGEAITLPPYSYAILK